MQKFPPAVNQIECHPFYQRDYDLKIMKDLGVAPMAWSPLAQGKNNLFADPTLKEIGEKYGKTAAQVNLRFLIQSGVVVIPKSTHKERMEENFNLFDFSLTEDEMKRLEEMDLGHSLFIDHYAPEVADMFVSAGKV